MQKLIDKAGENIKAEEVNFDHLDEQMKDD